jgi:hypothetical protein
MPATNIAVHEYGCTTKSYTVPGGVAVSGSVWNDCIVALTGYKSQQIANHAIAAPGHWSNPGNNVGNLAVGAQWNNAFMAQPHVHAGAQVRAAIGCAVTRNPANAPTYQFMKIYIGQFGG